MGTAFYISHGLLNERQTSVSGRASWMNRFYAYGSSGLLLKGSHVSCGYIPNQENGEMGHCDWKVNNHLAIAIFHWPILFDIVSSSSLDSYFMGNFHRVENLGEYRKLRPGKIR